MAQVHPFRGIHYHAKLAAQIGNLATPPYDVISETEKLRLAKCDPHNMVHLDLPINQTPERFYGHSQKLFSEWYSKDVFVQDKSESFYLLKECYTEGDQQLTRIGIFARVQIEKFENGIILPHERTHDKPFQDRLQLLRAVKANYSPVFFVYEDSKLTVENLAKDIMGQKPLFNYVDNKATKRSFWPIASPALVSKIETLFLDKTLLIADGHHRYRTSLHYREENPAAKTLLGYLANSAQEGFLIKPIHRTIAVDRLSSRFSFDNFIGHLKNRCALSVRASIPKRLSDVQLEKGTLLCCDTKTQQTVEIKLPAASAYDEIETVGIEKLIFKETLGMETEEARASTVGYFHDDEGFTKELANPEGRLLILVPPLQFIDIINVCRSGQTLPQKSTFFYPKVPTGLVINTL